MATVLRADVKLIRKEILRTIHKLNTAGESPTLDMIAVEVGCSPSTVFRHIKALTASDYIAKESGRGASPSLYKILPPGDEALKVNRA